MTKEDLYYRYFSEINEFTHEDLANMTQIDYDREMAFVAVRCHDNTEEILGVTRAISDPDNIDAEFAVPGTIGSQRAGARAAIDGKINYLHPRSRTETSEWYYDAEQSGMVALARKLGFAVDVQLEEGIVGLTLNLAQYEES